MNKEQQVEKVKEELAATAHLIWQRWMAYMLTHLDEEHIDRWRRQSNTPYKDLPEGEKESDRYIAIRYLSHPDILIRDADQSLPKLKALTGEATLEEKAAFVSGVGAMGERVLADNFVKVIEVKDD